MPIKNPAVPAVIVFDASDPTGAGGVQGALLTLSALGCLPLTVITAIGSGDTRSAEPAHPLETEWVVEQAQAILEDIPVSAILIGNPGCLDTLAAIAEIVADYDLPLIFVPMMAQDGVDADDAEDLLAVSLELLLPQTTVTVVDGPGAVRLATVGSDDEDALPSEIDAGRHLLECGSAHVLIADGRDSALQTVDTLVSATGIVRTEARPSPSRHLGSLATLGSAVLAGLARGLEVVDAVRVARSYLAAALEAGVTPGMGAGIPDRLALLRAERGHE
ncbi:bifunctional hydroxymethylpyrimidine kinase/phosphomethylpyrimidine kinase [Cognatazoarcus halotolerans]|uniref:bifunctional hydroxymethylpyrimidine kinase/phosphomethylpyrimidine kinase n=1 Tax=Cognatazoarcus halotolerans TaxID=2686016 RepID=UPI0013571250|nr:bifunctional hydroxymethylpyrimidine kinase/phosphomethylpyrimidine kinase [Cognatazoarcus halotolerans]